MIEQLEEQHQELEQRLHQVRSTGACSATEASEEESMRPYLPDEDDEANHQILESCTDPGHKDPTQVDSFQASFGNYHSSRFELYQRVDSNKSIKIYK